MFIKKFSVMMLAVLTAQALGFLTSVILAKALTPSEFGVYGLVQSAAMVLVPLILLSSSHSILVIKHKNNLHWVTSIVSASSFVALVATFIFAPFYLFFTKDFSIFIIVILAISMSYYQLVYSVFVRNSSHVDLAKLTLFSSLILFAFKTSSGYLFPDGLFVSAAHFLAVSVSVVFALYLRRSSAVLFRSFSSRSLHRRFKLLSSIIFFKTPTDLLSAFAQAVPVFALGYFFGASVAGYYVLAKSLVLAPSKVIAKAFTDISIGSIIQSIGYDQDRAYRQYRKLTLVFLVLSIIIFSSIFVFSPVLVGYFFGDEWSATSDIIRVLIFWLALSFIAKPASLLISKLRLNKVDFKLEVGFSVIKIFALLFVSYLFDNYLIGIVLYSVLSGIKYGVVLVLVTNEMNLNKTKI